MPTFTVIKDFNVLEDRRMGLFSCFVAFMEDQLGFQGVKKTLRDGVIPAITFAAHALLNVMLFEQSAMLL
jgi:hypothetical protein